MTYHEHYMALALEQARQAYDEGEVPVGAVIVQGTEVIAHGYNRTLTLHDPTAHAEVLAIREAASVLGSQRLDGCSLYVTLEPCPMCAGAILNARLSQLFFGAFDIKAGATGTLYSITTDHRLNHYTETLGGVLDDECGAILRDFFVQRREAQRLEER